MYKTKGAIEDFANLTGGTGNDEAAQAANARVSIFHPRAEIALRQNFVD